MKLLALMLAFCAYAPASGARLYVYQEARVQPDLLKDHLRLHPDPRDFADAVNRTNSLQVSVRKSGTNDQINVERFVGFKDGQPVDVYRMYVDLGRQGRVTVADICVDYPVANAVSQPDYDRQPTYNGYQYQPPQATTGSAYYGNDPGPMYSLVPGAVVFPYLYGQRPPMLGAVISETGQGLIIPLQPNNGLRNHGNTVSSQPAHPSILGRQPSLPGPQSLANKPPVMRSVQPASPTQIRTIPTPLPMRMGR